MELFLKTFIVLLTNTGNGSNHIKRVSIENQKCMIQPTLINLHRNECSRQFHYYPIAVKLDRCVGSFNTLNDLSNKVCVPHKTEDLNTHVLTWLQKKMNKKFKQNTYHANVNVNLMEENIIQIRNTILIINVDASVKTLFMWKKIIFGILLHVVAKTENT